ncbi:MAG: aminopeptidase [Halobacteriales archaeon]
MSYVEGARTVVETCMAVDPDDVVSVVTDARRREIGRAIEEVAREHADEVVYLEMSVEGEHGAEPPAPVAAAMRESDVVVAPTTRSLTHTRARIEACEAGARVATMPGVTARMMEEAMQADYSEVDRRARDFLETLDGASEVRVRSEAGTDLLLDVEGRGWKVDVGLCQEAGCVTNLPAGEVYVAPRSGDGRLVVDGSMAGVGRLDEPLVIEFEGGRAVSIEHEDVRERVDAAGDCGRNLAELGVGLNPAATLIGEVLQDEKVAGTVHVAVGDSSGFGGDVECDVHLDGVVLDPSVEVDGVELDLPGES